MAGWDSEALRDYARAIAEEAGLDADMVALAVERWVDLDRPGADPVDAVDALVAFLAANLGNYNGDYERATQEWVSSSGLSPAPSSAQGDVTSGEMDFIPPETTRLDAPAPVLPTGPVPGITAPPTSAPIPPGSTSGPATSSPRPAGRTGGHPVEGPTIGMRPFQEILGGGKGRAGFDSLELNNYFPVGSDPDFAWNNFLKAEGLNPAPGNPAANLLQDTARKLGRTSDLFHRFSGDLPQDVPNQVEGTEGAEGLRRILGDVGSRLGGGNTSAVGPQEGLGFLRQLQGLMKRGQSGEIPIENDQQQSLYEELDANPTGTVQKWMTDVLGGAMSPYLMANPQLVSRTYQSLFDAFRRRGGADTTFLDYVLQGYA